MNKIRRFGFLVTIRNFRRAPVTKKTNPVKSCHAIIISQVFGIQIKILPLNGENDDDSQYEQDDGDDDTDENGRVVWISPDGL